MGYLRSLVPVGHFPKYTNKKRGWVIMYFRGLARILLIEIEGKKNYFSIFRRKRVDIVQIYAKNQGQWLKRLKLKSPSFTFLINQQIASIILSVRPKIFCKASIFIIKNQFHISILKGRVLLSKQNKKAP